MNLLGKVLTELRDKYEEEENNDEKAVLEYIKKHGVEELVELVGLDEIVYNCKKSEILSHIDNFDIYLYKNLDEVLELYDSDDEIAQYLDKNGFDFSDYIVDDNKEDTDDDDFDISEALYDICRTLKPKGYIGKAEIKELINDYIDFNFN